MRHVLDEPEANTNIFAYSLKENDELSIAIYFTFSGLMNTKN